MFFKTKSETNEKTDYFDKRSYERPEVVVPATPPPKETIPEPTQEKELPQPSPAKVVQYNADLVASISRNTTIQGSIATKDNLDLFGNVTGSIASDSVVKAYGTVLGDISCETLVASGADITGDIVCTTSVVIGDHTTVRGNITATMINVSGRVDGNLTASESVTLSRTAVVNGDISMSTLEVAKGAVVAGMVIMDEQQRDSLCENEVLPAERAALEAVEMPETLEERSNDELLTEVDLLSVTE
ncbi:polymer-forming cytoskeletal protein [Oscillospiraceae bacterium PP1C4]